MITASRSLRFLGLLMIIHASATSIAQSAGTSANSRGRTSAEVLRANGIDLSEPSLLTALHNSNSTVRVNAAYQLASEQHADAVSAIEGAFSDERDNMARIGLAAALSSLHDPRGSQHLQAMCADSALPIRAVIQAVQMLQTLQISSAGCENAILESLGKAEDRDYRDVTISLLPPMFRETPREQGDRIVSTIQNMLIDGRQQPSVRMAAGQALAQIGLASSAEVLRQAISQESEPSIQSSLQDDLNAIQKKQTTH